VYENLKEEYSRLQSEKYKGIGNGMYGKHHTVEAKEKIRQANIGNKITDEQKAKITASKKGKKRQPFSTEWLEKLTESNRGERNGMHGKMHDEETKKKIGDKIRGRKQTEEEKRRRGLANIGKKKERLDCPHCSKNVAVNIYARYHGNNCKTILTLL
jgi:hypothetical protein